MHSWPRPHLPSLPGHGDIPVIYDVGAGEALPSARHNQSVAAIYVCGITPYDATHLGHAATYIAFDVLVRAWLDAGREVVYAQCVTDVDDPLLERANATGVDWRSLAERETDVYRADMHALGVIPPNHFVGVTEIVPEIADAGAALEHAGLAYRLSAPDGGTDLYADLAADPQFGTVSRLSAEAMRDLFGERGGDPDRPGKRGPLDPMLWRARRAGEPWWDSPLGQGRPGWHVECAVIAARHLGVPFDVQGGGMDLLFPHHEMSTSHLRGLTQSACPVAVRAHTGLIGLHGEKMSKSRGNLVLVSELVAGGVDPAAIRLALMAGNYRRDRDWAPELLATAQRRLAAWRAALPPERPGSVVCGPPSGGPGAEDGGGGAGRDRGVGADNVGAPGTDRAQRDTVEHIRRALALDLDTPAAIAAVDGFVESRGRDATPAPLVSDAIEALLGIALDH
ncbi:MAG: cysteine--1-D-myo-inosityl 2-amino-2-deoxy-alpha-D-glucopyranoside ligase [Bifidobacteriaceae bacterium]|nr:cysteine--1-D-myo-inosityl 2-amino-2-deoxy-alpha-D-glucopyranoside ligase [Bifidobacteriaceae bacterium]